MADDPGAAAAPDELIRLAVAYSAAVDRLTHDGGASIDELMAFFAEDAERDGGSTGGALGREAIRASFLRRTEQRQAVALKGVEVWGDQVVCRLERSEAGFTRSGATHNIRVLLVKGGKIRRLVVLVDADELARAVGPVVSRQADRSRERQPKRLLRRVAAHEEASPD